MNPLSTRPNRWRPITVFNLLVGLFFSITALGQPAFLKEGLVAYYPFNGNANDESGNRKNPSNVQDGFTANAFGFASSAFSFVKSNERITIPNDPVFNLNSQGEFTIGIWARREGDSAFTFLVNKGGPGGALKWTMCIGDYRAGVPNHPGKPCISFAWQPGVVWVVSDGFDWDSNWHHYVVTCKNGNFSFFMDGKSIGRAFNNSPIPANSEPLRLGRSGDDEGLFKGSIDETRIYNRALSDTEVKALYEYESTPQPLNPRTATATAQVVNGFVVGATITDGGYGYVSNPVVTIIGGGGTGAKATTTQFNGVVTSITITNPGIGYTSAPTITIAPPPFPPRKATSTAQIVNGFVVGTKVTDGGFGYDSPPTVLLVGGGGSGAVAVATVANGVVTAITITNPGTGYTSVPIVRIASPPFAPKLGIETSKVYVRMSVVLGRKYQLEASTDLNSWTTTGPAFIAQDEELAQEFDVNQVGRYFRINQVP